VSFRRRVAILAAAAVAVAVVLASALTYLLVAHQLRGQVDEQLHTRASDAAFIFKHLGSGSAAPPLLLEASPRRLLGLPPRPNEVRGYQQLVTSAGKVLGRSGNAEVTLPVDAATRALAARGGRPFFNTARARGLHLRILAEAVRPGIAVQFAQPLTEDDHLLHRLRLILALIALGGIALAALLGGLVARAVVAPVGRLTRAAEHVARTQDLSKRIEEAGGADEIGRLAVSFNAMLDALGRSMGALDASVHAQRQLVADASHELRTPVTSLRTNIEILQQAHGIDAVQRKQLYVDVVEQIEELTLLIGDLIDLARGEEPAAGTEDVRLDAIVREAVERARRNSPDTAFDVSLQPTVLLGVPARLGRAVNNLIDNAVKYGPRGGPVEIELAAGELVVRDHGPGIATGDLPHVFDRFYRGADARGAPGSGLGLAIVRQVVEQHGGTVAATAAAGGGTAMRVRLPHTEPLAAEPEGTGVPQPA
jgi:two-component system sensor histidine kinase MprB